MSDVKNATIIPYWKVLARFGAHIFPRGDMHTCCYCETFDEAQDAMDWYIKCGSYSEVRVVQCDMAYVGGLTQGLVGSKVVKRWHARKQEVRT